MKKKYLAIAIGICLAFIIIPQAVLGWADLDKGDRARIDTNSTTVTDLINITVGGHTYWISNATGSRDEDKFIYFEISGGATGNISFGNETDPVCWLNETDGTGNCPDEISDPNLKAWWPLNDATGMDVSGSGVPDLTVTGTPAIDVGAFGQGWDLDGAGEYGTIADADADFVEGITELTACGWISRDGVAGTDPVIRKSSTFYFVGASSGRAKIFVYSADGDTEITTENNRMIAGDMTLTCLVYDGSDMYVFFNGTMTHTNAGPGGVTDASANDLDIGHEAGTPMSGILDDVRIYDRVLTEVELQAMYNQWLTVNGESNHTHLAPEESIPVIADGPQFTLESANNTSPTIWDIGKGFGFQIDITAISGFFNLSNVTFEGNFSGAITNYTELTSLNISNNTATTFFINFTQVHFTGAGDYQYRWFATNGTANVTALYYYTITKNNTNITVAINGTDADATHQYKNATNVSSFGNVTGGTLGMLLNDTEVGASFHIDILSAGAYNYTVNFTHQNYTAPTVERFLTITQAPSLLTSTSSSGWSIYDGISTTLTCSAVLIPTQTYDGVSVSLTYTVTASSGMHDVFCGISDTQNYSTPNMTSTLVVNVPIACTNNFTFGYQFNYTTTSNVTTFNFTDVVKLGIVRTDLSDINVTGIGANLNQFWKNNSITNEYYLIVNNTNATKLIVSFGNYVANYTYGDFNVTAVVVNVESYTQTNPVIFIDILNEITNTVLSPPNATVILIPKCSRGENYITVDGNRTSLILAGITYFERIAIRIKYTADAYYSRQLYLPDETDLGTLDFYVVDAYENAIDRIDFRMIDIDYYNARLQLYKVLENTSIIITEGFFDASHYFSAYLMEDSEYFIRAVLNGLNTEFGTITVIMPVERELSQTTIALNPTAQLIQDHLLFNAYMENNYTQMRIIYEDDLNQTDQINITIQFGNGTIFRNYSYNDVSAVSLSLNTTDYQDEDWTVMFLVNHAIFGNSPVSFTMSLFYPIAVSIGIGTLVLQLISMSSVILVGGIATRRSIIEGAIASLSIAILLWGIGWYQVTPVFIVFLVVLDLIAIFTFLRGGGR